MYNEKKEMMSSLTWSERLKYFSLRLKYNCVHKRASFSCVTLEIFIFYSRLRNYTSVFKTKANEIWIRSLEFTEIERFCKFNYKRRLLFYSLKYSLPTEVFV